MRCCCFREGLEILCDVPGSTDESLTAHMHVGLGRALRLQGRLSEAEDAFREALIACSRALTNTDTTSQNRISTFEVLQACYGELQLCLYKIYLQVFHGYRAAFTGSKVVCVGLPECLC
jgi:hypothetical protein